MSSREIDISMGAKVLHTQPPYHFVQTFIGKIWMNAQTTTDRYTATVRERVNMSILSSLINVEDTTQGKIQ